MSSFSLSKREVWQDRANKSGKENEKYWVSLMRDYLDEVYPKKYSVVKANKVKYNDDGANGFILDCILINNDNNKKKFIENKQQNAAGNAHERAYKYFPGSGIAKRLAAINSIVGNPVVVIFSGGMAKSKKYIDEIHCQYSDYPNDYFLDSGIVENSVKFIEEVLLPQLE